MSSEDFSVVAIIAAHNEADIIEHVVGDLIHHGIHVYFLDDGSTDGTVAIVERFLGRGCLAIERLAGTDPDSEPAGFQWERILARKAQLATELDASWFIHHDADEFRESPWSHLSLYEAIRRVDALGFNAIDFMSLDFWPVHDRFRAGDDVRDAFTFYSEQAPYDRLQIRAWKKTADVDLVSSGGHEARFPDRRIFPVRFILRHYPIRGQIHGERKVFQERRSRFLAQERARGWHVQYDDVQEGASFIRDPSTLTPYDPDALRLALTLRHRGVEDLEASLGDARSLVETHRLDLELSQGELARTRAELDGMRVELDGIRVALDRTRVMVDGTRVELAARSAEVVGLHRELRVREADMARLRDVVEQRDADVERLRIAVDDGSRRLDELHQSLSWRWMSPARAVYRLLRGR